MKANCLPEMRKDRVYKILLFLDLESSDIVAAECGCPAGKAPCASCKHIGAMCFALEEFSRFGHLPEFLTCTDQLQQWNRPRPKKLEVIPVAKLSSRRSETLKKVSRSTSVSTFDPPPPAHHKLGHDAIETLRCDLLALNQPLAFLDILVPSADKVRHDHTYSLPPQDDVPTVNVECEDESDEQDISFCPSDKYESDVKLSVNVSLEDWERIERETRGQSSQQDWYAVRSKRITGSKCGKILNQKKKTVSLLRQCLYPKPLDPPPASIPWGGHQESIAIRKYISYKTTTIHSPVSVEKCGFIIPQQKGGLVHHQTGG